MVPDRLVGLVLFTSVFINLIQSGLNDWLIHLDESRNAECFFSTSRYFCHFNEKHVRLERNVNRITCVLHGTPLPFILLKKQRVKPEALIDWVIPFHLIEEYVDYLNSSNPTSTDETLLCNCTLKRIGIDCQYEIENKALELTKLLESQRGKPSSEFETLTSLIDGISCNGTSTPQIEWRQICDGITQCEDASDELNCHLLEMNQCDEDEEYRCRNGMCIPKQFAFDGTHDCLDSSDEQELPSLVYMYESCPAQSLYRCDERLCRKNQFSCGDGRCVSWLTLIKEQNGCRNGRHLAYRCETNGTFLSSRKNFTGICQETFKPLEELTETSSCVVSLRHFLTADREETLEKSMKNIRRNCSELIKYPEQVMFSPILATFYNRTELEMTYALGMSSIRSISRRAHLYCLQGKMICHAEPTTIHEDVCMTHDEIERLTSKYPFFPVSHLFCELASKKIFSAPR